MTSSFSEIRKIVMDMYEGPAWKRSAAKMPDNQIYAIYMNKLERENRAEIEAREHDCFHVDQLKLDI